MFNLGTLPVEEENDGLPWYYNILQYIKDQRYLKGTTETDKRTLGWLATNFILDGEILYKKGWDQLLLRCVDASKAKRILKEVHEEICCTYANGHRIVRQVMRLGSYWLTLEKDSLTMLESAINAKSTLTKSMSHRHLYMLWQLHGLFLYGVWTWLD